MSIPAEYRHRIREAKRTLKDGIETGPHSAGHENETSRARGRACRELAAIRAEIRAALEIAE